MAVAVKKVTNANVYADGENWLGRVAEFTPPTVEADMVEHKGLGMFGTVEVPAGGIKGMEATAKFASFYPEVWRKVYHPHKSIRFQVRSSVQRFTGGGLVEEVGLVLTVAGFYKSGSLGGFKKGEDLAPEGKFSVHYFRVVAGGEELLEVDVMNNIYRVAGQDVLATFRELIGG